MITDISDHCQLTKLLVSTTTNQNWKRYALGLGSEFLYFIILPSDPRTKLETRIGLAYDFFAID